MIVEYFEIKQAIIQACHWLEEKGYVVGTYGNVSMRVPGGLVITPSRVSYGTLTPGDMVTVSEAGQVVGGVRPPSSETEIHRALYLARPEVGAVVHTHSLAATALSCTHCTIPVIVEEQSQVVGGEIPCTRYVPAGHHKELGKEVARTLSAGNALLLANHGAVSYGSTLEEALFVCTIVERIAQMYLLTGAAGGPIAIQPEFVASERARYLYKYGKAEDQAE